MLEVKGIPPYISFLGTEIACFGKVSWVKEFNECPMLTVQ